MRKLVQRFKKESRPQAKEEPSTITSKPSNEHVDDHQSIAQPPSSQQPLHSAEIHDPNPENSPPQKKKCSLCGVTVAKTVVFDERHWIQNATFREINASAAECSWCAVLRDAVIVCIPQVQFDSDGILDWTSPFELKWLAGTTTVLCDLFCEISECNLVPNKPQPNLTKLLDLSSC